MPLKNLITLLLLIFLIPISPAICAQQETELALGPETAKNRSTILQAQLKALGPVDEKVGKDGQRIALERLIGTLTAIENARQRRGRYTAQLMELPKLPQQLKAEREKLRQRPPATFTVVTDALYEQYAARLRTAQAELEELLQEITTSELRINQINQQLEQQSEKRWQLDEELRKARKKTAAAEDKTLSQLQVEHLEWKRQLLSIKAAASEAERKWLTAKIPLYDERQRLARLRLETIQRDLGAINVTLRETIGEKRSVLETAAAALSMRLKKTTDPSEILLLTMQLKTIEIRKTTVDYHAQRHRLTTATQAQQTRNTRLKRDFDRLTTLVDKAAGGEVIGRRILILFERFRNLRQRYTDKPIKELQARLNSLNQELFALEDQLYEFDSQAQEHLDKAKDTLASPLPEQRDTVLAELSAHLDTQKTALRDQQQMLRALIQDVTHLLTLYRQYQDSLDRSYAYALTNVFWIRNAPPLTWDVFQDMLSGGVITGKRLSSFALVELTQVQKALSSGSFFWLLTLAMVIVLPLLIYGLQRWLTVQVRSLLTSQRQRNALPRVGPGLLIVFQSTLWPAYAGFLAQLWGQLPQTGLEDTRLVDALVNGLQLTAFIVWIALLGRGLLLQERWGQRFWQLSPKLCQFLQRSIVLGCVAAVVFLVPREILLTAPGEPDVAAQSRALARLLSLGFELAVLVLVGVMGRRESPLMRQILVKSRKEEGLLWHIWPVFYVTFLLGLAGIVVMGMLGYGYANLFIFSRALGSFLILTVTRLFLPLLAYRLLQQLINYLFDRAARSLQRDDAVQASAIHTLRIAHVSTNVVLIVATIILILELWGIPVAWVVASPLTWQILGRALLIALVIGAAILLVQLSNVVTSSLLRPKQQQGKTWEVGRKLRTLAPLVRTSINVLAIFVTTVVVLQLLGLSLGPVLAGAGIVGLAIGFAAQSLIKDIINGLFILFEDALSVGDIVDVGGGISGQVEKVSLRSVTIRDLSGNVHVVPNGTIDRVTNMTKEFSRYLLDVAVAYREDVDTVIGILQEIDAEMRAEPEYGNAMLEPIEIMGLDRFEASGVIVRARLKTQPIEQWRIGREFNHRLKKVFDERGIQIPFPHRTLYWGEPKEGTQTPISVAVENRPPGITKL